MSPRGGIATPVLGIKPLKGSMSICALSNNAAPERKRSARTIFRNVASSIFPKNLRPSQVPAITHGSPITNNLIVTSVMVPLAPSQSALIRKIATAAGDRVLTTLCTRGYGCSGHPVFPASLSGSHCALVGGSFLHDPGASRRENVESCLNLAGAACSRSTVPPGPRRTAATYFRLAKSLERGEHPLPTRSRAELQTRRRQWDMT